MSLFPFFPLQNEKDIPELAAVFAIHCFQPLSVPLSSLLIFLQDLLPSWRYDTRRLVCIKNCQINGRDHLHQETCTPLYSVSKPGVAGHFQLFKRPAPFKRISQVSENSSVDPGFGTEGRKIVTTHLKLDGSHVALVTLCERRK